MKIRKDTLIDYDKIKKINIKNKSSVTKFIILKKLLNNSSIEFLLKKIHSNEKILNFFNTLYEKFYLK